MLLAKLTLLRIRISRQLSINATIKIEGTCRVFYLSRFYHIGPYLAYCSFEYIGNQANVIASGLSPIDDGSCKLKKAASHDSNIHAILRQLLPVKMVALLSVWLRI